MNLSLKRKQVRNSYRREKVSFWAALKKIRLPLPRLPLMRGSFASVLTLCVLLIFVAVVVTGVCSLSLWLYGRATTSEFFATTHIDVTGNVRLSREMVLKYGGIREGDNSLSVSITEMERKLRATPWVEEVSVKRLLPDRFIIRIKERMPSFWVHRNGQLYYANERGEIIAPVESENFLSLPTLTVEPGGEDAIPYLERLIDYGAKVHVRTGVATVAEDTLPGIEREYKFGHKLRLGSGVQSVSQDRLPFVEREISYSANVDAGSGVYSIMETPINGIQQQ